MARSRSFLVILVASIGGFAGGGLSAQDAPKPPDAAPKFDMPAGGLPPPPRPDGGDGRREWKERRGWKPDGRPDGEPGRPGFQLPPEAVAMKEQAKKEFEKMTPEQRQKFWGNFKTWLDMPAEQRERATKMHEDRFQRARDEIRGLIEKSGLTLDDAQKKRFYERYFEERRAIEEKLRKEFDERRKPLLVEMEEKLKAEFSKPAETVKPAEPK
jgi:hypothetical protein